MRCVIFAAHDGPRRRRPVARNAASAPPRVAGADRAARSVINKGGARLRARAPRALRALGSLTCARPPPTTLLKTTILRTHAALLALETAAAPHRISNVNADDNLVRGTAPYADDDAY